MRVSVYIVLFLVFFNGGAEMLIDTGVADDMGIDPTTGNDEQLEQADREARHVDPGTGTGGTLFGLYNALATTVRTVFNTVFPGAAMLKASLPGGTALNAFIDFLFAGASIIVGLDTVAYFRGYTLV